jgi:chorismate lyase / 3-hydroxybenzoate synthase
MSGGSLVGSTLFSAPASPLRVEYHRDPAQIGTAPDLLAAVHFGETKMRERSATLHVTPAFDPLNVAAASELWWASGTVRDGRLGEVRYAMDDRHVFAILECEETLQRDLRATSEFAYRELLAFQQASGYPHLLRIWNYFDAINEGSGDDERYRQFSLGRTDAIEGAMRDYPAASALGTQRRTNILQVYWIAGRTAGTAIENPRQVSAYLYPREYGPVPPRFARATRTREGSLFISGTASIVGHTSKHVGDVSAQLEETLRNLAALKNHAQVDVQRSRRDSLLKVYVRDPQQAPVLLRTLERQWPAEQIVMLGADICRRELLVEAECIVQPQAG